MAFPNWAGNTRYMGPTGSTGPTGMTGPQGQNGVSGGLTLYLDSATSTTIPTIGSMTDTPNLGARTTITYRTNTTQNVLIAEFPSVVGILSSTYIPPGLWDFNIWTSTNNVTNGPSFYVSLYEVDADGSSNPILISSGASAPIVILNEAPSQELYTYTLYVPSWTLANSTKRIQTRLYGDYGSGNRDITFEFRDSTVAHVHTTLATTGFTGPTGPQGSSGPALSNWSPYPATSTVNLSNYGMNNASTITSTTTLGLNGTNKVNLTADRGLDVFGNAEINLLAQNGNHGLISLTANGGSNNGINGQVDITANGSTIGAYAQGGLINITANTPVSSNYTFTSAIKMGASSMLSYAGSFSAYLSLAGYNYTWGQVGVNITCSPSPPSIAIPNTAGSVFLYGYAGTKISNTLYVDQIKNYAGQDLTISSPVFDGSNADISINSGQQLYLTATTGTAGVINMNGNTTNIQGNAGNLNLTGGSSYINMNALGVNVNTGLNMTGNTIFNVPLLSNSAGSINITPKSGSNTQINSRLDMGANNIGTIGNLYFSSIDTIAGTASNFIISTHSNMTLNVTNDFTANASTIRLNANTYLGSHDIFDVTNIYSATGPITITTGSGNNLALSSGSNLTLSATNVIMNANLNMCNYSISNVTNINGAAYPPPVSWAPTATSDLNMCNYAISNVSNISSSSNLTLTGSNIYLNTDVIMGGPSSNYFSFSSKTIYGLKDCYADSNLNLYAGSGHNINLTGVNVNVNATMLMNSNSISNVSNIFSTGSGTLSGFYNLNSGSSSLNISALQGIYIQPGSGYSVTLAGNVITASNTITSTNGSLLDFGIISNAAGTGIITGYNVGGDGTGTMTGFAVISNSPSITIITPDLITSNTTIDMKASSNITLQTPNANGGSNYITMTPTSISANINSNTTGISFTNTNVDAFSVKLYTDGIITQTAGSNSIVIPGIAGTTLIASGGTITEVGGRRFHTFTSNDTFIVSANPDHIDIEVFGIGGGGGGGSTSGGGGGGGNAIIVSYTPAVGSNSIIVGAGGVGGVYGSGSPAPQGGTTIVGGILSAEGGGSGGTYLLQAGGTGGCGGGGSELAYLTAGPATLGSVLAGTSISNVAYAGGTGANNGSAGGAGGGGCSAVGQNCPANSPVGGNGGNGILYYGSYYGGGGGGQSGGSYWGTPVGGTGGLGGGGSGDQSGGSGSAGTANTGGGGGGSAYPIQGASGGSGIVIISYLVSLPNIVITDADGIDLDGPVITTGDLTVGGVLYAPSVGSNINMLSNSISNATSYSANTSFSNQVSFPFYSYYYQVNLINGVNFTPVAVSGIYNWYFDVSAGSPFVPNQTGAYDVGIQVVLPTYRSDGSNTPYPTLTADTRYTLTASTLSDYTYPFAYWAGTIGNVNDVAGLQQSGSNSFMYINVSQMNCVLTSNAQVYFQICFLNVGGSNFPNEGTFNYSARRMS